MRKTALFVAATLALLPALAHAEGTAKTYSDAEKEAFGEMIKDYLVNKNPGVIRDAMIELQKREQTASDSQAKQVIATQKDKIFNDPESPTGGNPKGDVTIVEFFDYQCGYCKMVQDVVERVLKKDKNVKIVYKEYPILSPQSGEAAKAALASVKQGKYDKFHAALMHKKDHFTSEMIYDIAKSVGLDVSKLKKDMEDPAIVKALEANMALGQAVGARGTPTFLIGEVVYPTALNFEQLEKAINGVRSETKL